MYRRRSPAMASPPAGMLTAPGACRLPRGAQAPWPRPVAAAKTGRPIPSPRPKTGRPIPVAAAKDGPSDPRRRGQSWLSDPGRRRGYGGSRCHGAGGLAHRVVPLLAGRRGPRHAPLSGAVSPLHGVARAVQPLGPRSGPARSPPPPL